jgi:endonuclease-8
MPEGPEIRLAADRIANVVVGERVNDVYFSMPKLRRQARRVIGAGVTAVDTRGKAMLTRFDSGLTLYSHNQLYGRWYVTAPGHAPNTTRSLRVALHTDKGSAWLYSASDIALLGERGLERHPFLSRLGPDVLDVGLKAADVVTRLEEDRFRRRALSALYLDQAFLAGIGNYLRSEILFCAGIDPSRKPMELNGVELRRLARETLSLSRRSYRTRGVLVPPALVRQLKGEGQSYREYRFWIFARAGLPCRRCGGPVERRHAGSRGLYVCTCCQSRPQ